MMERISENTSNEAKLEVARQLHMQGQYDQAEQLYTQLQRQEQWPQLSELLGILYLQTQRYQDAVNEFEVCASKNYLNPDLCFNFGKAYAELGGVEKAIACYQKALEIDPRHSNSLYNLANVYKQIENFQQAKVFFQKDLEISPKVDTCCALGEIYEREKKLQRALEYYRYALKINPDDCLPKLRIAIALQKKNASAPQMDFAELEVVADYIRDVLDEFPNNHIAYALLGDFYLLLGNLTESMRYMRKSIELEPNFASSHTSLGCQLLLTEKFEQGFKEFLWHGKVTEYDTGTVAKSVAASDKKEWRGEVYQGMHLLVTSEQGIGDQILHSQNLHFLLARGVRITMSVNHKLMPLFVRSFPQVAVYPDCYPIPDSIENDVDYQTSVLGLVTNLVKSLEDITVVPGYLQADEEKIADIGRRYELFDNKLKVGVSWISKSTSSGSNKTIALELWQDILSVPGVQFVNVQYGDVGGEINDISAKFGVDIFQDKAVDILNDQDSFAAQLKNLDLVITISNAAAHLAGALAANTWVVLSHAPLWHWLYSHDHCVWYPSVSLIRRSPHEHWRHVLKRIAAVLPLMVENKQLNRDLFQGLPVPFQVQQLQE